MEMLWILLTVGIIGICLRSFLRRFTGKTTCCGTEKKLHRKKKRLSAPVGHLTLSVGGMHCEHCRLSVTDAIDALDGVAAKVRLADGTAIVTYERPVRDEELIRAVESAGFEVLDIKREREPDQRNS